MMDCVTILIRMTMEEDENYDYEEEDTKKRTHVSQVFVTSICH